jgi:hypothetical protein
MPIIGSLFGVLLENEFLANGRVSIAESAKRQMQ